MRVDQYGNGVASAPGVKGGHVSAAHNWINFDTMTQVLNSGVMAKGITVTILATGRTRAALMWELRREVTIILKRRTTKDDSGWMDRALPS